MHFFLHSSLTAFSFTTNDLSMTHPLELPTVIERIGLFIPLCNRHYNHALFQLQPRDLISCTRVSWTWHKVLTPILWALYVDQMNEIFFPCHVIEAQAHLIRRMEIKKTYPYHIQSTNLRALSISSRGHLRQCASLIRANPRLKHFHWTTSTQPLDNTVQHDIQQAIESLTQLRTLYLVQTPLQFHSLARILQSNPYLLELKFTNMKDVGVAPACTGAFTGVRVVHMYTNMTNNPETEQVFTWFPNLESLKFMPSEACSAVALVRILQKNCPKLVALHYVCRPKFKEGKLEVGQLWHMYKTIAPWAKTEVRSHKNNLTCNKLQFSPMMACLFSTEKDGA